MELKPCPFCGGVGRPRARTCDKESAYDPLDRAYPVIRCITCPAEVSGDNWTEPTTAAANWNIRHIEAQLRADLASSEGAVHDLMVLNETISAEVEELKSKIRSAKDNSASAHEVTLFRELREYERAEKLRTEVEELKTKLAMAEDAAQKGQAGRDMGTALEECLAENAKLRGVLKGVEGAVKMILLDADPSPGLREYLREPFAKMYAAIAKEE